MLPWSPLRQVCDTGLCESTWLCLTTHVEMKRVFQSSPNGERTLHLSHQICEMRQKCDWSIQQSIHHYPFPASSCVGSIHSSVSWEKSIWRTAGLNLMNKFTMRVVWQHCIGYYLLFYFSDTVRLSPSEQPWQTLNRPTAQSDPIQ